MAARKGKKGGTKGKGPSKNKSQEAKVASAMKSINNNRTPLSSLLPTQKMGSFRTSDKKGDRAFKSFGPSKVLLAATDPGSRPTAPTSVASVSHPISGNPTQAWLNANPSTSYGAKGWDTRNRAYPREFGAFRSAQGDYLTYRAADRAYRSETLPNYETASSEFSKKTGKNISKTSEYTKDLATFFNQKGKSRSQPSGARNVSSGRGSRR